MVERVVLAHNQDRHYKLYLLYKKTGLWRLRTLVRRCCYEVVVHSEVRPDVPTPPDAEHLSLPEEHLNVLDMVLRGICEASVHAGNVYYRGSGPGYFAILYKFTREEDAALFKLGVVS